MELIRSWLIGITASAMAAALADSLAPDGAVKKIGKLACGLLMVIAIVRPLAQVDYASIAGALANYRIEAEGYSAALETENERLIKTIIAEHLGAYIQDKAAELGAECTAEVSCRLDDNGDLYPASVIVYGELDPIQVDTLCRVIEGDLAIPAQNQYYERERDNEGEG